MKKHFFIPLIAFSFLLSACARSEYKTDISCKSLADVIAKESGKELSEYDAAYTEFILKDTSIFDDCRIIYTTEVNDIDEFGIFRSQNEENAKTLYTELLAYIKDTQKTQRAFIESYAPLEAAKLDTANAERIGNYVIYFISDSETGKKISSAVKTELRK